MEDQERRFSIVAFAIVALVFGAMLILALAGCQRGDFKVSPVLEGQAAPHAGYNIGLELWLEKGMPAKVTGAVIRMKGLDPNNIIFDQDEISNSN